MEPAHSIFLLLLSSVSFSFFGFFGVGAVTIDINRNPCYAPVTIYERSLNTLWWRGSRTAKNYWSDEMVCRPIMGGMRCQREPRCEERDWWGWAKATSGQICSREQEECLKHGCAFHYEPTPEQQKKWNEIWDKLEKGKCSEEAES